MVYKFYLYWGHFYHINRGKLLFLVFFRLFCNNRKILKITITM